MVSEGPPKERVEFSNSQEGKIEEMGEARARSSQFNNGGGGARADLWNSTRILRPCLVSWNFNCESNYVFKKAN